MVGFGGFGSSGVSNSSRGAYGITIAPSNATSQSKKKADVVLTGIDDHLTINKIIQQLENPNGVWGKWQLPLLSFTEGHINLGGSIILKSDINIVGNGYNTIFRLQDGICQDLFTHDLDQTLYHVAFRNFAIDGNYQNNKATPYYGINIRPQECEFEKLWIRFCYNGARTWGENTFGMFITRCMIDYNFRCGIELGGDTIMTQCGIGGNARDVEAEWIWGGSGILLSGWNSQIIGNHFADNLVDIFSNWSAYTQVQGNIFEAGIKENIILEGRAWAWTITSNRFGSRLATRSTNAFNSILFRLINENEKAYGNVITNNAFSIMEAAHTGYNYCIEESEHCDYNLITNNVFKDGYHQTLPVLKVGANTVLSSNID